MIKTLYPNLLKTGGTDDNRRRNNKKVGNDELYGNIENDYQRMIV